EQREVLEGASDAERGDAMTWQCAEIGAGETDVTGVGLVEPRQAIEQRRLAGSVRADQAADDARRDGKGDSVECDDAAEAQADVFDEEQRIVRHVSRRPLPAGCGVPSAVRGAWAQRRTRQRAARGGSIIRAGIRRAMLAYPQRGAQDRRRDDLGFPI